MNDQPSPMTVFRGQLETRQMEFAAALPAHIPVERFVRVIMTAVTSNAALLYADRVSLFSSSMKAAADGLLCDGREAALVIYRTKKKGSDGSEYWVDAVQYMPMVAGILKKCRNSGELQTIVARVVYEGDKFRNWIDDAGEHIEYEAGETQNREVVRSVFAMARLKDGAIEVEVLKPTDIEKIRSVSRSKDKGPWVEWWEEMAKKSAIRRLSKRLPLNTDLDDLIRRDDELYDLAGAREEARLANGNKPQSLASRLDMLANMDAPGAVIEAEVAPEPREAGQPAPAEDAAPAEQSAPATSVAPEVNPETVRADFLAASEAAADMDALNDAWERIVEGRRDQMFPPDVDDLRKIHQAAKLRIGKAVHGKGDRP